MVEAIVRNKITKEIIKRIQYPRFDLKPIVNLDPDIEVLIVEKSERPAIDPDFEKIVETEDDTQTTADGVPKQVLNYTKEPLTVPQAKLRLKDRILEIVLLKLYAASESSIQVLDTTNDTSTALTDLQGNVVPIFNKLDQIKTAITNATTLAELRTIQDQVNKYV